MQLAFCQRDVEAARRDLVRICSRDPRGAGARGAAAGGRQRSAPSAGAPQPARPHRGRHLRSCAGRGGPHFGAPSAELQIVRHALGDVPLVGFFAGRRDRPPPPVRLHRRADGVHSHPHPRPATLTRARYSDAGMTRDAARDGAHQTRAHAPGRSGRRAARRAAGARAAVAQRGHRALRMRRPHRLPRSARWWWRCPRPRRRWRRCCEACHALEVPVVARGAGTGLSGGAMPHALGVTLSLAKFNRILQASTRWRARPSCSAACATWRSARRPRRYGLYYAPDPSQPDRLHHRRQRGRELGRRALPEVRPDAAQRAEGARLHGRRRAGGVRQRGARRAGLRPAGAAWSAAKACWR